MKPQIEIQKASETEIIMIKIIPEQVIPEQRTEETVSLSEVKTQLNTLLVQIKNTEAERDAIIAQLNPMYEQRDSLQSELEQADALGVKISVEPKEEIKL